MSKINSYSADFSSYTKKGKEKNDKSIFFKLSTLLFTIFLLTFLLSALFSLVGFGENEEEYIIHQVKKGESLWSIAVLYYEDNIDIRKAVYHIRKANSINSPIINPGEKLIIPVH